MSYARSLGREEEKRYSKALENGSAVTYVDENGEAHKGVTAPADDLPADYRGIYEEQMAVNNAAAAAAAEEAAAKAERDRKALSEEYDAVNKGLYRQYRKALASLPQELAAMGYTGGTSESSRVELERGYEEELGQNERSRVAGLTAIRDAEAAAVRQGRQEAAKANSAARKEFFESVMGQKEREYAEDKARAEQLAATGDFSGYEKLGYSPEEIERLRIAWEAENPELAIAIAALSGRYSAEEVAAMPAGWVQQYLNALGYDLSVNGRWDSATEKAFKAVFGCKSGRYTAAVNYSTATEGAKAEEKTEEKTSGRGGSAGTITVRT